MRIPGTGLKVPPQVDVAYGVGATKTPLDALPPIEVRRSVKGHRNQGKQIGVVPGIWLIGTVHPDL